MARRFVSASTQYFDHPSASAITDAPFSVSAWLLPTAGTENKYVFNLGKTGSNNRQHFYTGNNTVYCYSGDSSTFGQAEKTGLTAGVWKQVGVMVSTNSLRYAYVDGVAGAANTTTMNISGFDRMHIACGYNNGSRGGHSNDTLADIGLWNVALSADDWAALAAGVSPRLVRPDALVGYWPLHGRATDEEDWVGGRHMTANNGPITVAESPRIIVPASYLLDAPAIASGATTHETTGVLAGPGGAIDGTSARIAVHGTSGVLAGSGATVAGSAARTRAHPASGVLAGGGASVAGTARHNAPHPTSGTLAGGGAEIAGAADHAVPGGTHDTSGALEGGGAAVAGTAAHIAVHAASGVLAGSGAVVDGTAARVAAAVTHATSGALVGGGAQVSGLARGPEPDAVLRRHAGFRREQVRKGYIIKGERYWLTEDELMQMVAQELATISRKDVKQITKTKPKVISKQVWDAIKPLERLEALTPIEPTQDDDEEDVLMMFV